MTDRTRMTDTEIDLELERFFKAERARDAAPPDALMGAVLRDADRLQPAPRPLARPKRRRWSVGLDVWQALGGWQAAAVMGLFLGVGISLGYSQPDGLADLAEAVISATGTDVAEAEYFVLDELMAEG